MGICGEVLLALEGRWSSISGTLEDMSLNTQIWRTRRRWEYVHVCECQSMWECVSVCMNEFASVFLYVGLFVCVNVCQCSCVYVNV